jgi:toxin ParE1/3/4
VGQGDRASTSRPEVGPGQANPVVGSEERRRPRAGRCRLPQAPPACTPSVKVLFHPQALVELRHLATWYEERSDRLGSDFRDEVARVIDAIAEQPGLWPLSSIAEAGALGVHHFVLRRFPVTIEYVAEREHVAVLAIAHMRRKPGYWLERTPALRRRRSHRGR